ncbi:hypothetical protein CASFOL_007372 [Castilleja foliolosa]|uniref:Exocyst subunit Exo70 family protein n=1 Tax=Castilleja foliolosa TaxID=1961234 RepID=A0ABD3E9W3_9LAMI
MFPMENLISATKLLKANVDKSKALESSLGKTSPRLNDISQRLASLEVAIRPILAPKDALSAVGGHINRAVVPATAVLKVFDAVHGLEKSLPDPHHDLPGYLDVLKRLEEASKFLGDNCGVAIQWLSDIVEYLADHNVADNLFITDLNKTLDNLGDEKGRLDGGLLEIALSRLENEFRLLLTENSVPIPFFGPGPQACIAPSPLPVSVINKLQLILMRLVCKDGLKKCVSIYVDVRGANARASLRALDLDYLEISSSEFNDVSSIEAHIAKWGQHLEFAVKHLFEAEYNLCEEVFDKIGSDIRTRCFVEVVGRAGFVAFLRFGKTVTESKKDPIKLLKLLDIFASLSNLRLDFNRLFGGAPEIQNMTRDLIRSLIEGVCEIFWELSVQVELQRHTLPPPDRGVPRVVSFITEYSNKLLGDEYKPILTQALVIERSWKREKFKEKILIKELLSLVKAIELNLDTWSKRYEDEASSYIFLMNNHCHLYKQVKGTKLGGLLGDFWIRGHEEQKEYYSGMYLKESWGKLPARLSREGLICFSGGRATARDLVKQRLKSFNEAFDEMYKKQSDWIIADSDLREKTRRVVIQTVVPVYRSYMQNYGPLVEQEKSPNKYVKYTAVSLEKMLNSLFNPKSSKRGSFKARRPSGKLDNGI